MKLFIQQTVCYAAQACSMYEACYSTWVGHIACMGEWGGVYRVLVGKPEGKRPLGRPRHRWEDNIMMNLQDVGWGGIDRIDLAEDRYRWRALVNVVTNFQVL